MKNLAKIVLPVLVICGLVLAFTTSTIQAAPPPSTPTPLPVSDLVGTWSAGTETPIDLTAAPAPYPWLQLLGNGAVLTAPGKLCRDFRGGQFGWTADIRELVNGKWIKVPTTQGWLNGEEAPYTACAVAPSAGTYAFFAYYTEPEASEGLKQCVGYRFGGFIVNSVAGSGYSGIFLAVPAELAGTPLRYKILSYVDIHGNSSGDTISPRSGKLVQDIVNYYYGWPVYSQVMNEVIVRIYTSTCYSDVELIYT
jgi:hypothetical protein